MKVLTLTVSKEWFDLICQNKKDEEYREIKPYWIGRLLQCFLGMRLQGSDFDGRILDLKAWMNEKQIVPKPFTHVLFINGYGKNRPRIEKEIVSITIGKPKKGLCPTEYLNKDYFIIKFK